MTLNDIKDRIAARRAEAVERRAIAEAATPGPWEWDVTEDRQWSLVGPVDEEWGSEPVASCSVDENAAHIAANDPATVIRDQDRIIAGCDADLALVELIEYRASRNGGAFTPESGVEESARNGLAARYADTDGGAA
jgi:hypothetical protein